MRTVHDVGIGYYIHNSQSRTHVANDFEINFCGQFKSLVYELFRQAYAVRVFTERNLLFKFFLYHIYKQATNVYLPNSNVHSIAFLLLIHAFACSFKID